jgi:8-oxo-dGTP diphosphatase
VIDRAVTDDPRVLLIRRANPPRAGSWSLPGGKVEPGELIVEAVMREILEETGLAVEVGPLVEVVEILAAPHHYVVLDYLCTHVSGTAAAASDADECAWVSVHALAAHGVTEAVVRVVGRALAMSA